MNYPKIEVNLLQKILDEDGYWALVDQYKKPSYPTREEEDKHLMDLAYQFGVESGIIKKQTDYKPQTYQNIVEKQDYEQIPPKREYPKPIQQEHKQQEPVYQAQNQVNKVSTQLNDDDIPKPIKQVATQDLPKPIQQPIQKVEQPKIMPQRTSAAHQIYQSMQVAEPQQISSPQEQKFQQPQQQKQTVQNQNDGWYPPQKTAPKQAAQPVQQKPQYQQTIDRNMQQWNEHVEPHQYQTAYWEQQYRPQVPQVVYQPKYQVRPYYQQPYQQPRPQQPPVQKPQYAEQPRVQPRYQQQPQQPIHQKQVQPNRSYTQPTFDPTFPQQGSGHKSIANYQLDAYEAPYYGSYAFPGAAEQAYQNPYSGYMQAQKRQKRGFFDWLMEDDYE